MKVIILWSLIFIMAILCLTFKKRTGWLSLLFLTLGITLFSLLTPEGKLLWQFHGFRITLGALEAGLFRAGILIFLQLLSKLIISSKTKLPGKAGAFVNQVFGIYEKLTASKIPYTGEKKLKIDSLIKSIDDRLISAWNDFENL
ncbi:MAG: hypothetical protein MJ184_06620 [Treponema sp.]|uniref:hypothetical protein n=1 Tax=Treponema sp. TaxID=166 RepID=UPI00298E28E3|nr:hypothetical protein [Treponema sp.]MCQ2601017.1 hypothetical protein [Treponema sp.]